LAGEALVFTRLFLAQDCPFDCVDGTERVASLEDRDDASPTDCNAIAGRSDGLMCFAQGFENALF